MTEFDLDRARWDIPAERMKMKTTHIPLSRQAVRSASSAWLLIGNGKLVFPGALDKHTCMSNNTLLYALYRLGYGTSVRVERGHLVVDDGIGSDRYKGSPRLAVNPVNAILTYLYALLEAECRLAVAALGLDPEMGVLHMDTINRDSFACDLMEPIRSDVDAYVLNRIVRQPLKRNWFFEERNGNCRLMADLASHLVETASTWARLVAPLAEWAVKEIASTARTRRPAPATRLTQNRKRALTGGTLIPSPKNSVRLQNMCSVCGNEIRNGIEQCWFCAVEVSTQRLTRVASEGRVVSHTATAEAKRSKTQLANHATLQEWSASDQPSWLTAKFYEEKMQPLVADLSSSAIVRHLSVSRGYAAEIRRGRVPHPRHWRTLSKLLGVSE